MRKKKLHPYAARVLATLRRRGLLAATDRVLVGLSAGPDSTALVAALAELRDAGHLASVAALHVDHGLRAGGGEDAAAAKGTCERFGVAFESVRVVVGGGNVQAQARRARYAALRAAATRAGANRIATGHTRSDQAETVLLRLLRGAGARGLGGIPPKRGAIVRPLIDRARGEGLAYLGELGLAWREDPSNATPRFARNRIRHEILPALRALAPAVERSLARTADLVRADEQALAARARQRIGAAASVDLARLDAEPEAVRRRIVRRLWRNAGGGRGLERKHVEAILDLLARGRPGRATLRGGLEARCRYGRLEIGPVPARRGEIAQVEVVGPGRYGVPERGVTVEVAAARPDAIRWPLALRTRRAGDRFRPDGGRGTKKLKSWLIDRKVPREVRDGLLLLARGDRVVAIADLDVVADGLGPAGAGLVVRLDAAR